MSHLTFIALSGPPHFSTIHFAVVFLMLSPLFILIAATLKPPKGRPYMASALFLLCFGTGSLFMADSTQGTKAGSNEPAPSVSRLETRDALNAETKVVFAGLTAILSTIYLIPRLLKQQETRLTSTFLPLTFLTLYAVGIVFLANSSLLYGASWP